MKTLSSGFILLATFIQVAFALDCGEGLRMRFLNSSETVCHAKCSKTDSPLRLHNGQSLECCNVVHWMCETDYEEDVWYIGMKNACQRIGNNALVSELYTFGSRRFGVLYDFRCVLEDARQVTPRASKKANH